MFLAIKPKTARPAYSSGFLLRREQREQIARETQEPKGEVLEQIKKEEEEEKTYVVVKKEEGDEHDQEDEFVQIKHEDVQIKHELESRYDSSEEPISSVASIAEADNTIDSEDGNASEEEDEAQPLDKKSLRAVIKNPRASVLHKGLAQDILYAHRSRTMTRKNYGGVYKRYVCDTKTDGVVYDRRIGAVVKRLVPSPLGTFHVYDRLDGKIRRIRMIDGMIRKNEGIELQVREREKEAGHEYEPQDAAEEMDLDDVED